MYCYYCGKTINKKSDALKHGLHEQCFNKWFKIITPAKDFSNITLKGVSKAPENSSDIDKFNKSFFHGAFKKYSAEIEGVQYILKMAQNDFLELPKIEWISNQIYKILGVEIADFYLIRFNNELDTFVTKNFMDRPARKNLIHIYHFLDDKSAYSCEVLLNVIAEKCGRLIDIKKFIEMTLCDSLIGNHDRHGRNIGLIQKGPATFEMSPIYDNPSYIGIEDTILLGADLNPKGKIFTAKTQEPTLGDYIDEFCRLGFFEIVYDFIDQVKVKISQIRLLIEDSDISDKRKKAFIKLINKRMGELE